MPKPLLTTRYKIKQSNSWYSITPKNTKRGYATSNRNRTTREMNRTNERGGGNAEKLGEKGI